MDRRTRVDPPTRRRWVDSEAAQAVMFVIAMALLVVLFFFVA